MNRRNFMKSLPALAGVFIGARKASPDVWFWIDEQVALIGKRTGLVSLINGKCTPRGRIIWSTMPKEP